MRIDRRFADLCAQVARALCGVPDYEAYLAHWRKHQGGSEPMDRAAFNRQREAVRYSRGRSRCC